MRKNKTVTIIPDVKANILAGRLNAKKYTVKMLIKKLKIIL